MPAPVSLYTSTSTSLVSIIFGSTPTSLDCTDRSQTSAIKPRKDTSSHKLP